VWTMGYPVSTMGTYLGNTRLMLRFSRPNPLQETFMQTHFWKCAAASVALAAGTGVTQAKTLSDDVLRIGVLTDISGVYADISGRGAVEAVRMAVEDFGGTMFGKPIEVVFADHLNKPDVGAARAREWF